MILHICTASEWSASPTDDYQAPSLDDVGFIHCSDPGTAHLPANALFAGRTDLLLLVIDPARLDVPVRWEPGVPPAPSGAWFPHVYGKIRRDAVIAAHPFPPDADGTFRLPAEVATTLARTSFGLNPIGAVRSALGGPADAPKQADEDAPPATLVLDETLAPALDGLAVGDEIVVLTWLDRASRTTVTVHPRGDTRRPAIGVLATRAPDRPNPVGLHTTTITAIDGTSIAVDHLEAFDQTPVLDVKPVLGPVGTR